ncbi:MAG: DUF58 domain-containing protein [Oscillospiraceae bacterium]|nr:DUF58 domain-containing protein [Oscillospiraceae bacterium]
MITTIIFLIVVILLVIEGVSLWGNNLPLEVEFDPDTTLVEPGEIATLHYSVHNPNRLPLLFVGLCLHLAPEVTVRGDQEFSRLHVSSDYSGVRVDHHFYLPAHSTFRAKLRFSLSRRGLQQLGRYSVETGDFLGLYPIIRPDVIGKKVICTSEKCAADEPRLTGGELGEVSVRRFIMDDPTMLLGYRDYTGREPMKQISWKQTAKVGRPMVRQNDFTTDRVAVVMVNMDSSQRSALENCLKLTRTVCEQLEEAKVPYSLMSNGDLLSVPEGIGRGHLFFILRRLGLSRLAGFTSFESLVERCVRRRRSNCSYIIITPLLGTDGKALVDYLARHVDSRPIVMTPGAEG